MAISRTLPLHCTRFSAFFHMPCNIDSDMVVIPQSSAAIPRTVAGGAFSLYSCIFVAEHSLYTRVYLWQRNRQQLMNLLRAWMAILHCFLHMACSWGYDLHTKHSFHVLLLWWLSHWKPDNVLNFQVTVSRSKLPLSTTNGSLFKFSCVTITNALNPFLPEFIIPAEPLNAGDKMAAPGRSPKQARNTTSSAFFRPKR